mmetsp:Transcript_16600/g.25929  ORF Transcript_16600/g.25929 Transcript_16600/m.25929 type:complete len:453 (-) Transcript_16600:171-1529(-)
MTTGRMPLHRSNNNYSAYESVTTEHADENDLTSTSASSSTYMYCSTTCSVQDGNDKKSAVTLHDNPPEQHNIVASAEVGMIDGSNNNFNSFYKDHCIYLPYMAGWFFFSSLLTTYNKALYGTDEYNFPCPLLITSIQFLLQWIFSYVLSTTWSDLFGGDRVHSMSWEEFWSISIPCGAVTALDIGLSNMSLARISMSFYIMVKSGSPVFVLAFALFFKLEPFSWGIVAVVLLITMGEFIVCSFGELDFDLLGFLLCVGSALCSAARWTLIQFKLNTLNPPLKSSIATIRIMAPSMFVVLLSIGLTIEQPWEALKPSNAPFFADMESTIETLLVIFSGGIIAMCLVGFEFCLIIRSSAMVLMVGGVMKELLTILIGEWVFHDVVGWRDVLGYSIVFSGVVLYKYLFHMNHHHDSNQERGVCGDILCDEDADYILDTSEASAKINLIVDDGTNA